MEKQTVNKAHTETFSSLRIPRGIRSLFFFICFSLVALAGDSLRQDSTTTAPNHEVIWAELKNSLVPLRSDTRKDAPVLEFLNKGQNCRVIKTRGDWVQVQVNEKQMGWLPRAELSRVEAPLNITKKKIKWFGILILGFVILISSGIFFRFSHQSRQARLELDKLRLANKVLLCFNKIPELLSNLLQERTPLPQSLLDLGYQLRTIGKSDEILETCLSFRPHIILADIEFEKELEAVVDTDVILLNTPIIYLNSKPKEENLQGRIRVYLPDNCDEGELIQKIQKSLAYAPKNLKYSITTTALAGNILPGNLVELFHFFAMVKKTGELKIKSSSQSGLVQFWEGHIAATNFAEIKDEQALDLILALEAGSFEFQDIPVSKPAEGIGVEKFLLTWAKKNDEKRRTDGH